ncbi:hypothetical protein SJA_C1-32720 [Sphingobium indicum UT26S]|uniref:Uncharacterized protein n=1 Tax=Sphingobium indicum (strain DSM 16413 / CCM 7287 / MTCC 6362 / UT26 / NBRC 101211 / UT26S) TaxID=452662 RepID=D4Z674_SPHIU|nr:hypothetical protein L286_22000 [Sphingobium sp. HDIP04]BAI98106.1 hypothetical protein SJA_C1-32720 [Sphingobium indicum UT26S]
MRAALDARVPDDASVFLAEAEASAPGEAGVLDIGGMGAGQLFEVN